MKLLYLIYSREKASGGHYHSCDQISRSLADSFDIEIVSIGTNSSPVLIKNPNFREHITYINFKNIISLNKSLNIIKSDFNPDLIHCYDAESLNLILPLPALWDKKIVMTKCGGPNPIRNSWQYANTIINFSYENHSWFVKNNNYKDVNLHLLANRVNSLKPIHISKRKEKEEENVFTFIRIARIGGAYEKTLLDTFNLIENLKDTFKVKLYVIGRIQNNNRFEFLKQEAFDRKLPVYFITDKRASKASDFLYLADCVIGTGRSFMEATSLKIPTLTPVSNHNIPILVTKKNFNNFFKTNFSERNISDKESIQINFNLITDLIGKNDFYKKISKESYFLFKENFSTENIADKYNIIYQNCINKSSLKKLNLVYKNRLYLIKNIFSN